MASNMAMRRGTALAAPRSILPSSRITAASFSTTASRAASSGMQRSIERNIAKGDASGLKGTASIRAKAQQEFLKAGGTPLFTGTVLAKPLTQWPWTEPRKVLRYTWALVKTKLASRVTVWNMIWSSAKGVRPQFKHNKRQIPSTAQALYSELLAAFAEGNLPAIKRLSVPNYASKLAAAIEKRNPKEAVQFEVLGYHNTLFYPRLKTSIIHNLNDKFPWELHHQAVVAIDSTQQVTRIDKTTGRAIPGSAKIQRKIEHVVLTREVDKRTWETTPWKIWGTTTDTSLEEHEAQMKSLDESQERIVGFKDMKKE